MKKISIAIHQDYLQDVIRKLHETGYIEIIDIQQEDPTLLQKTEQVELPSEIMICANLEARLTQLITILTKAKTVKSGMKNLLSPQLPIRKHIEKKPFQKLVSYSEKTLQTLEKTLIDADKKLKDLSDQVKNINETLEHIKHLTHFQVDLSHITHSSHLMVLAGRTDALPDIEEQLKLFETVELFSHQIKTGKKSEWAVLIVAHVSEKEKIEKILKEKITTYSFKDISGTPTEALSALQSKKEKIGEEKQTILHLLKNYEEKYFIDLLSLREEIQLERAQKEITRSFTKTKTTYIIKGWVLERNEAQFQSVVEKTTNGCMVFDSKTPSTNPDNPPTYLDIPKWAHGFKSLVGMFATPRYNELDPSIIMGIFFVLFFGFMLGDAGYGLIILLLALFGYLKYKKVSNIIRVWGFMGIWMGLVTTIVGFLTNSFFGDLIPRFFNRPLYPSFHLGSITFPVESLSQPLLILMVALILGLAHLNVGILLGLYQAYQRKEYKSMLTERFCFIPLQIGGGLLIGNYILGWELTSAVFYFSCIVLIIGLILLFVHSGPIGFFSITGYIGDWLSYARLLALGLATAGMALAFNVVSQLIGEMIPFVGFAILVLLLVIMHVVNLGLQALGAGVHSLRLQYVEFFNRFYEGGGHEFSPFQIHRRYTTVDEEKRE